MIKNYREIFEKVKSVSKLNIAVVMPYNEYVIEAVCSANNDKLAGFTLIGDVQKIQKGLAALGVRKDTFEIINETDEERIVSMAIEQVRSGKSQLLMKGDIKTSTLLKGVLDKEKGLRTGKIMSHIFVAEIDRYPKLMLVTDGGMIIRPDLEKKKCIIKNAIEFANTLGIKKPKIALLAGVEVVNPEMPETVDANEIVKLVKAGEFGEDVIAEGPIAMDIALSKEAARLKGCDASNSGDFDIFVVPDLACGNILCKGLIYLAGAKGGGIIWGAQVPIILLSRSDDSETKLRSIALGLLCVLKQN